MNEELVPVPSPAASPPAPALPTTQDLLQAASRGCYTSIPADHEVYGMAVLQAAAGEKESVKEWLNRDIQIVGFTMKASEPKVLPNGELTVFPIVGIILENGDVLHTCSKGILEGLTMAGKKYRTCPWNPPLAATVKSRNWGEQQQVYYLKFLTPGLAAPKKK